MSAKTVSRERAIQIIFEKHGINKAPSTWDEYIDVCKKIV